MSLSNTKLSTYIVPFSGLLALSLCPYKAQGASKAKQPNVIFIMTDDQGYGDLACHGNEIIKTPNIDQLHSESIRFTNYHVSPTSAPTRSALMTGRYSNRVGVWHTIGGRSILWPEEVTLAQVLSANGYTCGIFGKWHLGDNYPSRPQDKGFSEVLIHGGGGICQGSDFWGNDYFDDTFLHNGEWEEYKGYCTDVFFEEALKFIETNQDKPFFCYLPVNAPHSPFNVPEEYYNIYKDCDQILDVQKQFYGMITNIDDNFGRLDKRLKELGLDQNTIVIFMTDNGTSCGARRVNGKLYGNDGGFRGTKASKYEGGHRVPFFIRYPEGNIMGGRDIDRLSSHVDILPTMIDYLNLKKGLPTKALDGRSLVPLLTKENPKWEDRIMIVDAQRRHNLIKWRDCAIMTQRWRLIDGKELYDMDKDTKQTTNVADQYPEVVARLTARYEAQWQEYIDAGVIERYGYITVGSEKENPTRIAAHEVLAEQTKVHVQTGVLEAETTLGVIKIEVATTGKYRLSLHRYPAETSLKFNSKVPAVAKTIEVEGSPESKDVNFKQVTLHLAQHSVNKQVDMNAASVDFTLDLTEGRYDLNAYFTDEVGIKYPIYYMYIEKL